MDQGLTEEQQREFTEAFNDLDKNHTGFLSPYELGVLMRSLGHTLTDEDLKTITSDSERSVTLADFLDIMAKREQDVALQEKLQKAFSVFDCDGSGFISVDLQSEFRTLMTSLGPNPYTKEEFEQFLSEYLAEAPTAASIQHPASEDFLVDYQEFIKLMLRK
uniref:EF-hand domain-containing protein n=1 Tax=Alexandrium andersonii TaxID=327968 RepID=A0A7S2D8E7_9DINO|mmetsp:Transcript_48703/g.110297  ORF Transcript_48703/g.110297 Transcript_48703/m.110297 type:complete len:162 (+) Transcript_48703:113-598(+)